MTRSFRVDQPCDGFGVARPLRELGVELSPAGGGESIELRAASDVGVSPLGVEPTLVFHAMEGGIERALFDLEALSRRALDPLQDREAVHRPPGQRLEHEEVERAAKQAEIGFFGGWSLGESANHASNLRSLG